jgi:DamX protein
MSRKLSGAAWLWSRNPEHLTMQLLEASSASRVHSYLCNHEVDGQLAIIRVERGGKPWYLLLSGEYVTGDEVARALAALPAGLKEASPWGRSFASLQDEMMNPLHVSH